MNIRILRGLRLCLLAFTTFVVHFFLTDVAISQEVSLIDDEPCEFLMMTHERLSAAEKVTLERLGMSESPVEVNGQAFYLLHQRLKGSCIDHYYTGRLLEEIVSDSVQSETLGYLRLNRESVIDIVLQLWSLGSFRKTDLSYQRELILTFEGFNPIDRNRLIEVALNTEGFSHAVLYSLWSPIILPGGTIEDRLRGIFKSSGSEKRQIASGLTLLRFNYDPLLHRELVGRIRASGMPDDKTESLHVILDKLADGKTIQFSELDGIGLIEDD